MQNKHYYVYMMTNERRTAIYTGVTGDLSRRVAEHKQKIHSGFTAKYNATRLVFFEQTNDVEVAIDREKQIKAGSRKKKVELIERQNKEWRDLAGDLD